MSEEAVATVQWAHVPCPLCGADDADPIYERDHETGSSLGRIHKVDVLCRPCGFMYTSPRPSAADVAARRGLDVVQGEIETSQLEGDAYDVVSCISALEHVWDMPLVLGRIAEMLRPGGLAFIEVPDSTRPIAQIAECYSFEPLSHFTRSTLLRALGQAGLEPVAWDGTVTIPNLRVCARRCSEGRPVHAPGELPALALDAILISTQAFEQEVYDGLQPAAQEHGIEVVRCYG